MRPMKLGLLFALGLLWSPPSFALVARAGDARTMPADTAAIAFEANQGQAAPETEFVGRGPGYTLLLGPDEAVLAPIGATSGLRFQLVGANRHPRIQGLDEMPGKSSYYRGNATGQRQGGIPRYARVRYQNAYPGVDVVYYGNGTTLESDFVIGPRADPSVILLRVRGADTLAIDGRGDLVLTTPAGEVRLGKPEAYQQRGVDRTSVAARYVRRGSREVAFRIGAYDHSRALVIDPSVVATYLLPAGVGAGGHASVTTDAAGNLYATSNVCIVLTGIFTCDGSDARVEKRDPGHNLLYVSYLGGSLPGAKTVATGIASDALGNAYLTGLTDQTDLATAGAYQTSFVSVACGSSPCTNAFVAKLDAAGSVAYFTYLGPSTRYALSADRSSMPAIAADGIGNVYVTGPALPGFPTTAGAFQAAPSGGYDAFVVELDPSGATAAYATYLGGSMDDAGAGIAVDAGGSAYVTGVTFSADFPTTPAVVQPTKDSNAFVTKLAPDGAALVYSTFVAPVREGYAIAVDAEGDAYVTGVPARIVKLGPDASQIIYSTSPPDLSTLLPVAIHSSDMNSGIALNAAGEVWISSFYFDGASFFAKLDAAGTAFEYAGIDPAPLTNIFNPGAVDQGIAVDPSGNAYVAGYTPFLSSQGARQGFLLKIADGNTPAGVNVVLHPVDATTGATPITLTFSDVTQAGSTTLTSSASGPATPAGFQLGNPPTYFELTTTAVFSGPVTVCIDYSRIAFAPGTAPQLFHYESGAWLDVTVSLDPVAQVICGSVNSFSPFAIFQPGGDTTPPVIVASVNGSLGNNGWYKSDVLVSWSVTDPDSPVSSSTGCGSTSLTSDSAGATFTCTATSAGGTASSTVTIKRDATAPRLTFAAASPSPNAAGWNNTSVSLAFAAADNLSGLATTSVQSPLLLAAEGTAVSGSVTITDAAGNVATFASPPVMIDKTPPAVTITTPAGGAVYTLNQAVASSYSCADAMSGMAGCAGPVSNGALIDTATPGTKSFTVNGRDVAGNSRSQSVSYQVVGVCHYVSINPSPSTVPQGGRTTIHVALTACASVSQTVVIQFALTGPTPPGHDCGHRPSFMFETPPVTLAPNTALSLDFPHHVSEEICPGAYSIKATTLVGGRPVDVSSAAFTVTPRHHGRDE